MYKKVILDRILDYLKKKKIPHRKSGKMITFQCPYCKHEKMTAMVIPNTNHLNCVPCNHKFDLIKMVKQLEPDKVNLSDEDVLQYLKELLSIEVMTEQDENQFENILDFYEKNGFDLVPVAKDRKNPVEKEWTTKNHKNKDEWKQWLMNGLNIGVKTGAISNMLVLDIDIKPIPDELKKLLPKTLNQESSKGYHYVFKYTDQLPKTRIDELKLDIETDGGQVVFYPSVVAGVQRKINLEEIAEMPPELLKFLKGKTTVPRKTHSELIVEDINREIYKKPLLNEGDGRNELFVRYGGILRKQLNMAQTEYALNILNKMICSQELSYKELQAMVRSLEKYCRFDDSDLKHKMVTYLKNTDEVSASKAEIEIAVLGKRATGEDKQKIDKMLVELIKDEKIIKKGERQYKLVKSMDWSDSLISVGKPIDFDVPYINDYAFFNWGDFLILGSQNKYGKTTLAMNVVKHFVEQGIKPYYIYSESGGRFSKTALRLGLKDGDFWHIFCGNPEEIHIEPNSITIYDWVRPTEGFNKTDVMYDRLVQKLQKNNAFMICFVQLKNDNGWFAPNMITQYPALAMKYMYENENDGTHTKFEITQVRDPKVRGKKFEIPCIYDFDKRTVTRVESIQSGEE
jgi:transcription elongation factor Elf1